jgi:hypothetical protein
MSQKKWLHGGIVGMLLGLGAVAGCDNGSSDSGPGTQSAGIPGVRGPASPKTNAFTKGSRPGAKKVAPTPAPEGAESEKTPSAPQ